MKWKKNIYNWVLHFLLSVKVCGKSYIRIIFLLSNKSENCIEEGKFRKIFVFNSFIFFDFVYTTIKTSLEFEFDQCKHTVFNFNLLYWTIVKINTEWKCCSFYVKTTQKKNMQKLVMLLNCTDCPIQLFQLNIFPLIHFSELVASFRVVYLEKSIL